MGFGLGPTLEAYSLISKELQKTGLELWRTDKTLEMTKEKDQSIPEYVDNRYGLYPSPLGRNAKANLVTKVRQKFKFLGKFMAKALMDSRMVCVPPPPSLPPSSFSSHLDRYAIYSCLL